MTPNVLRCSKNLAFRNKRWRGEKRKQKIKKGSHDDATVFVFLAHKKRIFMIFTSRNRFLPVFFCKSVSKKNINKNQFGQVSLSWHLDLYRVQTRETCKTSKNIC